MSETDPHRRVVRALAAVEKERLVKALKARDDIVERFKPGAAPEIYRRARTRGRRLPPGLEYVDSWVDLTYTRCFQLMRTEEPRLFEKWISAWADLVDFEVIPVRTSSEAAQVIAPKL